MQCNPSCLTNSISTPGPNVVALQLKSEQADYEEAVAKGPTIKAGEPFDIGMRVILVHGDEIM